MPVQDFSGGTFQTGAGGQGPNARGGDIGSHNVTTTHNYNNYYNQGGSIFANLKEELRPVFDAGIIANKACLEGTRTGTLDDISNWIDNSTESRVFFLVGGAGLGKSAIAHRIGLIFQARGRLGSFFCFNRSYQSSRNPDTIFPTIAYNLAQWNGEFGKALASVVQENRSQINMTDVTSQWKYLILEPIESLPDGLDCVVIVIDALDESGTEDSRQDLLSFLTGHAQELPSYFRILVTSRPEPDVIDAIQEHVPRESWMDLSDQREEAVNDIGTYIRHRFEKARLRAPQSADMYAQLTRQADGVFQWAFTVCEWVLNSKMRGLSPKERLQRLSAPGDKPGSGLTALDVLYSNILNQTFDSQDRDIMARFRAVMAQVLSVSEPLSIKSLDDLYCLSNASETEAEDEIRLIVPNLGALLIGAMSDDIPVRPYHTSFRDFLTSPTRSQEWSVSQEDAHSPMAVACFRVMNRDLKFNICNLPSSFLLNKDMIPAAPQNHDIIPQPLNYACQHWMDHIVHTSANKLWDEIITWGTEKLLFWFESLSILGIVDKATFALTLLAKSLSESGNENTEDINGLLQDAIRFIQYFGYAIAESAPHIYLSALPFTPKESKLAQQYSNMFRNVLCLSKGRLEDWPAQVAVLTSHQSTVTSVVFSSDGRHIVSGSGDETVRIWDPQTSKTVQEPLQHSNTVTSVAISHDGRYIVSGMPDCIAQVWDLQTGKTVQYLLQGHTSSVASVALSPDGQYIASGSSDCTVRIWDSQTGKMVQGPLQGHTGTVTSVAFSPDKRHIASGSGDLTVCIWDLHTGKAVQEPLQGHSEDVTSVAFSPNERHIVTGSRDNTVRIWDLQAGKTVQEPLLGHTQPVTSVAFSPDGRFIASGSEDNTVRIWDSQTGKALQEPLCGHSQPVTSVAFSPDSRHIVSGSWDNTVRIWEPQTGKTVQEPVQGHSDPVRSVAYSPDGKYIVSGSSDFTVRIWDSQTGEAVQKPLQGHEQHVVSVGFSSDNRQIASGSWDNTIRVWDSQTGETIHFPQDEIFTSLCVDSLSFSPDGQHIVSGSENPESVQIWDLQTGKITQNPLQGHTSSVSSIALSPDGQYIVTGSEDCTIRVWDSQTGKTIQDALQGHTDSVTSVAFSYDNRYIVSGSLDGTVRIWDLQSSKTIQGPLQGHTDTVTCVAFSHDSRYIVSGSDDHTAQIWDSQTGKAVQGPLRGHTQTLGSVAFSPNGEQIVSGSWDNTIRIWDSQTSIPVEDPTQGQMDSHNKQAAFFPERSNIDPQLVDISLDHQSGWLYGPNRQRLFWIPSVHRLGLHLPGAIKVIGAHETTLDFPSIALGTDWTNCFIPLQDDSQEDAFNNEDKGDLHGWDWLCHMLAEQDHAARKTEMIPANN